jgi:transposase InsO family protein
MKTASAALASALMSLVIAAPAFASPNVYVVNFRHAEDAQSQRLDSQLPSALQIAQVNAEEVVVDTTTAAKWEKTAHDAFNRDIVPVFNKWVGLPGFAAVVDAQSKTIIGCLDASKSASDLAQDIKTMAYEAAGQAQITRASTNANGSPCPATFNHPPVQ